MRASSEHRSGLRALQGACALLLACIVAPAATAQVVVVPTEPGDVVLRSELPLPARGDVDARLGRALVLETDAHLARVRARGWRIVRPAPVHAAVDPLWTAQPQAQLLRLDWLYFEHLRGAGAVVAVVDTGIDTGHVDAPTHVLDGWDFVDGDPIPTDEHGHGTAIAGTLAAPVNGVGIHGVAPEATVLPVRVLNASGVGSTTTVALGIRWATDHGADVINLSLGGSSDPGDLERDAIAYARAHGAVVVCASGNGGTDATAFPGQIDECLTTGAATEDLTTRAAYSQYGAGLDLIAPGTRIPSTSRLTGGWSYYSGTSLAAPHVAGTVAMLVGAGIRGAVAEARIVQTARDLGEPGTDSETGAGLLDPTAALGVMERPAGTCTESLTHWLTNIPDGQMMDVDGTCIDAPIVTPPVTDPHPLPDPDPTPDPGGDPGPDPTPPGPTPPPVTDTTGAPADPPAPDAAPAPLEPAVPCVVPALTSGSTLAAARAAIEAAHCTLGRQVRIRSAAHRGIVLAAGATAGTQLARGARVNVILSAGRCVVPRITPGAALATARRELRAAGCSAGTIRWAPSRLRPGRVLGLAYRPGLVRDFASPVPLIASRS